jgi:hypothetical protein
VIKFLSRAEEGARLIIPVSIGKTLKRKVEFQ